jgi:uncharacterized protein (UPF0333 family)
MQKSFMAKKISRKHQKGQIAVEYMLLLVLVVTLYFSMMSLMTKRGTEGSGDSGFIIEAWDSIIKTIGQDYADDSN